MLHPQLGLLHWQACNLHTCTSCNMQKAVFFSTSWQHQQCFPMPQHWQLTEYLNMGMKNSMTVFHEPRTLFLNKWHLCMARHAYCVWLFADGFKIYIQTMQTVTSQIISRNTTVKITEAVVSPYTHTHTHIQDDNVETCGCSHPGMSILHDWFLFWRGCI